MEDGNLAILVDAKTEYTKQLVNIISPNIYLGIKKIYNSSREICENNNDDDILCQFQIDLSEIPKWNQEIINKESDILIKTSDCDWLEDLLTAVFVSHTRILTSINFNKNKNKINLKIPKVDHFIHLCYIEVARHFWKNPYLFDDTISKFEYQRNRRDSEKIIDNTINETIRKQLPVKHILKEYLGNDYKDTKLEDETISENNENDNLRKMVKAEIENCSKEKLEKLNIQQEINMDIMEEDNLLELHNDKPNETSKTEKDTSKTEESPSKTEESPSKTEESPSKTEELSSKTEESPSKTEELSSKKEELSSKKEELSSKNEEDEFVNTLTEVKLDNPKLFDNNTLKEVQLDSETDLENKPNINFNNKSEINLDNTNNIKNELSDDEKEINTIIDNEVDNLKIESLNLNFGDDLNKLEEIYIDEPKENISNNSNKIKTVFIDTKNESSETDNENVSKNDYSFFE